MKFNSKGYMDRFKQSAARALFKVEPYGMISEIPLYVFTRQAQDPVEYTPITPKAHIYISAGIHGDEPAGPLALMRLMNDRWFRTDYSWTIFPLLNPIGMQQGTRNNGQDIDINRDYNAYQSKEAAFHHSWFEKHSPNPKYDLSLCLHEDWETTGFYLYKVADASFDAATEKTINQVREFIDIEPSEVVDGFPLSNGIIQPLKNEESREEAHAAAPEALYLYEHWSIANFTFETPSSIYIEDRVSAQCAAIQAIVEAL